MPNYTTPGVYIEEKSVLPPSVAGVSTAIPAFVGYTAKAGVDNELIDVPVRITSITEYETHFGKVAAEDQNFSVAVDAAGAISVALPTLKNTTYYNLKMFFDNGGGSCYIVSVSQSDPIVESYQRAINALSTENEPTLLVVVQHNMALTDYTSLVDTVLQQCAAEQDRFGIFDMIYDSSDSVVNNVSAFRDSVTKNNLKYGATYFPNLETNYGYEFEDDLVMVSIGGGVEILLSDESIKEDNTALYNDIRAAISSYKLTLPPSAAVAGAYASTDRDRGVWKAPANVSLSGVLAPAIKVTNEENGLLNVDSASGKSVNVIRFFSGQGNLIWGARTLAGNDNEWRYVPVRRLFNYVEESIKNATSYAVFEPNDALLWTKLKGGIESFLVDLWRQGALAGASREDAYFVDVGLGKTMTSQDVLEGRLIIRIGMAAVRPAEFIILEFTHKLQE